MRDPARIDRILDLLRVYWVDNPDMRLGQIVVNACYLGQVVANNYDDVTPFSVEDEVTEVGLRRLDRSEG